MKDALLQERAKILKDLAAVDHLLLSKYGWSGDGAAISFGSINYKEEFANFLESMESDFSMDDFKAHVESANGVGTMNKSSARNPLREAIQAGSIYVFSEGRGRKQTRYKKTENEPETR